MVFKICIIDLVYFYRHATMHRGSVLCYKSISAINLTSQDPFTKWSTVNTVLISHSVLVIQGLQKLGDADGECLKLSISH